MAFDEGGREELRQKFHEYGRTRDPVLRDELVTAHLGLARSPTIAEVAERAGASEEEVLEAMEAGRAYRFASLDAPGGGEEDSQTLASQLGEDDASLQGIEHRVALSPLISELPRREQ